MRFLRKISYERKMESWLFLVLLYSLAGLPVKGNGQPSTPPLPSTMDSKHVDIYKSLFSVKRREQIETAEKVWNVDDYAKQYQAITFVVDTVFPILQESLKTIREISYVPGSSPFPEERSIQEELGKVYENVIFFGDFLLRMPDITKKVFKRNKEWRPVLEEAVKFCNESADIYSGPHARQLHLMSQEMGLVPKDPDYINPFKAQQRTKPHEGNALNKRKKAKKGDKKNKGPKLRNSRQFKSEL